MSEAFDAEYYLRRCGEDQLARDDESDLVEAARALTTIGLVDMTVATDVVDGYARATTLRDPSRWPDPQHRAMRRPPNPVKPVVPGRVWACDQVMDQPWGQVHVKYVLLDAAQTTVGVTIRTPARPAGPRFIHRGMPAAPMTDDRKGSVTGEYSGSGSDDVQIGRYTAAPGLHPQTQWLTIFGTRIELTGVPPVRTVTVERFGAGESLHARALRYLAHGDSITDHRGGWDADTRMSAARAAFVACGALAADDPVSTATPGLAPPGHRGGPQRPGPSRLSVIGADIDAFDGLHLRLLALTSDDDGLAIEFDGTGEIADSHHRGSTPLGTPRLAYRGRDDLGHDSRGFLGEWGSGSDGLSGTIRFQEPLDPAARQFTVVIETEQARATVQIPLHPQEIR